MRVALVVDRADIAAISFLIASYDKNNMYRAVRTTPRSEHRPSDPRHADRARCVMRSRHFRRDWTSRFPRFALSAQTRLCSADCSVAQTASSSSVLSRPDTRARLRCRWLPYVAQEVPLEKIPSDLRGNTFVIRQCVAPARRAS